MNPKKIQDLNRNETQGFSSHHHSMMIKIEKMKVMVMITHVIFTIVMSMVLMLSDDNGGDDGNDVNYCDYVE